MKIKAIINEATELGLDLKFLHFSREWEVRAQVGGGDLLGRAWKNPFTSAWVGEIPGHPIYGAGRITGDQEYTLRRMIKLLDVKASATTQ